VRARGLRGAAGAGARARQGAAARAARAAGGLHGRLRGRARRRYATRGDAADAERARTRQLRGFVRARCVARAPRPRPAPRAPRPAPRAPRPAPRGVQSTRTPNDPRAGRAARAATRSTRAGAAGAAGARARVRSRFASEALDPCAPHRRAGAGRVGRAGECGDAFGEGWGSCRAGQAAGRASGWARAAPERAREGSSPRVLVFFSASISALTVEPSIAMSSDSTQLHSCTVSQGDSAPF